ncbi:hypothetical protein HOE39_02385 [Candidatus Woesearchaeota archaeon]|jgi:hypothetical protein|nr:hypothetical protein [Candidatus Woesearchaeota archaeon]
MTNPQEPIGAEEYHYEVKVIGDSNIFGQHDGGGSEGLAGVRNLLYSKVGKDNVKSHTHSTPPHWKIKIRDEHVGALESFVKKESGLTFEKGAFQFKGISIKDPSLIDYLLSSDKRVDALEDRNSELIRYVESIETDYDQLKDEHCHLEKDHTRVERKLSEARQAANVPIYVAPQDDSTKERTSKLYNEVVSLEKRLSEAKKLSRNVLRLAELDRDYCEGIVETQKLYSAAGADFDQKDLEYYTAKELLKNEFGYESITKLVKEKNHIDRRISPICNFTQAEFEGTLINDEIPFDEFLVRGMNLFDETSDDYLTRRERTDFFGKDLGNRLRDHFAAIRSFKERGDDYDKLQKKSILLERIRLAYESHSDAQETKDDRERVGKRVHKRLNQDD